MNAVAESTSAPTPVRLPIAIFLGALLGAFLCAINPATAAVPPRGATIEVDLGRSRLSAELRDVTIREVLQRIGDRTGASISGLGSDGDRRISLVLRDRPYDQALRLILGNGGFLLRYAAPARGGHLVRISLVASGAGSPSLRRPVSGTRDAHDLPAARGEWEAASLETVGLLAVDGDRQYAKVVLEEILVGGKEPEVRSAALAALAEMGLLHVDLLIATATSDGAVDLRLTALEHLADSEREDPRIGAILAELAVDDPDASVRGMADVFLRAVWSE